MDDASVSKAEAVKGRGRGLMRQAALIGGQWVAEGEAIAVDDPADGSIIGYVPALSKARVDEAIKAAADAFRMGGCDSVIALGGGSAIDVAKIIRLVVAKSDKPLTSFKPDDAVGKLAPFCAIPTTAGTGSEVGRSSVVSRSLSRTSRSLRRSPRASGTGRCVIVRPFSERWGWAGKCGAPRRAPFAFARPRNWVTAGSSSRRGTAPPRTRRPTFFVR